MSTDERLTKYADAIHGSVCCPPSPSHDCDVCISYPEAQDAARPVLALVDAELAAAAEETRQNVAALIESMDRIADEREAFKVERNNALAKVKAVETLADDWAAHIEGCADCDYGEQLAELRTALAMEPTP